MRIATIFFFALLLVSCGTTKHWTKDGADPEQVARDLALCEFEAAKATGSYSAGPTYAPNIFAPGSMSGAISYGAAVGAAGARRGINEAHITDACMRALGYHRERLTQSAAPPR